MTRLEATARKDLVYRMARAHRQHAYRVVAKLRRQAKREGRALGDCVVRYAVISKAGDSGEN